MSLEVAPFSVPLFDKLIGKRSVDGGVLAGSSFAGVAVSRDIGWFYVSVEYIAIIGNGDCRLLCQFA